MQVAAGICAAAATPPPPLQNLAGFSSNVVAATRRRRRQWCSRGEKSCQVQNSIDDVEGHSRSLDGIPNHSDCLFVWEKVSSFIIASSSFVVFTEVYGQKSYRIDFNSALKPTTMG